MSGPGTSLVGGPLFTGTVQVSVTGGAQADMGTAQLSQTATLVHNTTSAVSYQFNVPPNAQILDFLIDTTTAWNSATSDTLSIGTSAAATTYVSSVDVKAAASRLRPTYSGAQLLAMSNVTTNTAVVVTVTPVGSATAGNTIVTMLYVQNVN